MVEQSEGRDHRGRRLQHRLPEQVAVALFVAFVPRRTCRRDVPDSFGERASVSPSRSPASWRRARFSHHDDPSARRTRHRRAAQFFSPGRDCGGASRGLLWTSAHVSSEKHPEGGPMPAHHRSLLWLAVPSLMSLAPETSLASRGTATRSVVWGAHGMVCAAQPLAVQTGLDILKQGGSAVDAAIAVNACLGLMEPTANGLGGDLFALVWDPKEKRLAGIDASGRAPRALAIEKVPPDKDGTIPLHSPYAWTVPGCADG